MSNDENLFLHVIDVGLRVYGNGTSYSPAVVRLVQEAFRHFIATCFRQHLNLIASVKNDRHAFFTSLIYFSRQRRRRLKRLKQYLQAKERQESESVENLKKKKQISAHARFDQLCRDLKIEIDSKPSLDRQRARQYVRLDEFYRSQNLSPKEYLSFVDEQNHSFNQIRSLSVGEILRWAKLNDVSLPEKSLSIVDLRLSELVLFLLKEFLLELMDEVFRSSKSKSLGDVFRRRYVKNERRKRISRRQRFSLD